MKKALELLLEKAMRDINPLLQMKATVEYGYPIMVTFSWVKSQKVVIDFTDEWLEKKFDSDIIFIHSNDTIEKVEEKIKSVIEKIKGNGVFCI